MDDLAAFLAARLDEDDAAAKSEDIWFGPYPETIKEWEGWLVIQQERLLREVAAKRAILELCADDEEEEMGGSGDLDMGYAAGWKDGSARYPQILRALAAVYSGHPDYRQEWAP